MAGVAFVTGEVAAFATFVVSQFVDSAGVLVLRSAADWRLVAGYGVVYALFAVTAVAVGSLIRHPAGAVAALLVWFLAIENLINLIPGMGADIYRLLRSSTASCSPETPQITGVADPLGTIGSLGVLLGTALVLLSVATVDLRRRDA